MITNKPSYKQLPDGTLIIKFPMKFPATNGPDGLLRMGPAKYATKRNFVEKLIREMGVPKAPKPCIIWSARHYCKQPLDCDSAVSATKLPLDALVHAGVLDGDGFDCVQDNIARQYKVGTIKEEYTVIALKPVNPDDQTQQSPWPFEQI